MIHDYAKICERIQRYNYHLFDINPNFSQKVTELENAIDNSITQICEKILEHQSEVHIALSGGIDSSTIVISALKHCFPVVAHTVACNESHPDMVYSRRLSDQFSFKHIRHVLLTKEEMSEYNILFKCIKAYSDTIICGDCIDELLGGYYAHQMPQKLIVYDPNKQTSENRLNALHHFMKNLITLHLTEEESESTKLNVQVFLPYADENVFEKSSKFCCSELVDDNFRKKPMIEIAKRKKIPIEIIYRKKYGLCSIMENVKEKN